IVRGMCGEGMRVEEGIEGLVKGKGGVLMNKNGEDMLGGKVLNMGRELDMKEGGGKEGAEKGLVCDKQERESG
ncbi:hypothetical protein, partial [Neisseria sicca]|uniref:hypothetical protein n=1 Tax=Neisseria sicca TaxID=490 RepID=UPI00164A0CF4